LAAGPQAQRWLSDLSKKNSIVIGERFLPVFSHLKHQFHKAFSKPNKDIRPHGSIAVEVVCLINENPPLVLRLD
jgi:hypothetical protein